jgi:hypothetical protein
MRLRVLSVGIIAELRESDLRFEVRRVVSVMARVN